MWDGARCRRASTDGARRRCRSADEQLWSALVAVYQAVLRDLVAALEQDGGIDSGVYSVLAYLERAETPGRLPLRTLHELMHVRYSQPGLSRLVQRMEADGLVERSRVRDDGRAFTSFSRAVAGRASAARATCTARRCTSTSAATSAPAEASRLARALGKLAAHARRRRGRALARDGASAAPRRTSSSPAITGVVG